METILLSICLEPRKRIEEILGKLTLHPHPGLWEVLRCRLNYLRDSLFLHPGGKNSGPSTQQVVFKGQDEGFMGASKTRVRISRI
jgi:hypothetical protein